MKATITQNNIEIGYIIYELWRTHPPTVFVHEFQIYKGHRGKGYFKLLISEAQCIALNNGMNTISLSTPVGDNGIRKMYERCGFVELGGLMVLRINSSNRKS